jgi:hypothetical protein
VLIDRNMEELLVKHGAKRTDRFERRKMGLGMDERLAKAIRFQSWTVFPGGQNHVTGDAIYQHVRNADGRRVMEVEVEEDGRRINVTDDAAEGVRIAVRERRKDRFAASTYRDWDHLKRDNPAAFTHYDKYRTLIEADLVQGHHMFQGPGQVGGSLPWPILGVACHDVEGVVKVTAVAPGTAAEAVGLAPGDVVAKIAGRTVPSFQGLRNLIAQQKFCEEFQVEILRDGTRIAKTVVIEAK